MDYGTTKFDIYRAILEGLVLDQRLNMAVLAEQDVAVQHLIAVGGGSKSRPWLQIKSDILQIPVSTLKVKEAGALGCAILCAAAAGFAILSVLCGVAVIKEADASKRLKEADALAMFLASEFSDDRLPPETLAAIKEATLKHFGGE